jgi:hypothetical protein
VFACTPAEWLSWSYNVSRARDAAGEDAYRVLAGLAMNPDTERRHQPLIPESLPPLIPLLDHRDPVVANGMASLLGREYRRLEIRRHERARAAGVEKTQWTAWCAPEDWALAELAAVSERLRLPADPSRPGAAEAALLERVEHYVHTPSLDADIRTRRERWRLRVDWPADAKENLRRGENRPSVDTNPAPEGAGTGSTGAYE